MIPLYSVWLDQGMSDEWVIWLNGSELLPIQQRVGWMGMNCNRKNLFSSWMAGRGEVQANIWNLDFNHAVKKIFSSGYFHLDRRRSKKPYYTSRLLSVLWAPIDIPIYFYQKLDPKSCYLGWNNMGCQWEPIKLTVVGSYILPLWVPGWSTLHSLFGHKEWRWYCPDFWLDDNHTRLSVVAISRCPR